MSPDNTFIDSRTAREVSALTKYVTIFAMIEDEPVEEIFRADSVVEALIRFGQDHPDSDIDPEDVRWRAI